ncbi:aspartic proteinase CDR1-like [Papaver somniferum]|uniref:aspartic proteinase CDR1-like n=1 Tax=Papaver somniferum TaxID=3469 RepID=UPI000E6FD3F6|nr:aspartic proteinase CDR1-like [Papaver somniferum]
MGGIENALTLFILLTISHVSLLLNSVIAVNPSGFSMKIIHRDSIESPLYPGDHLTQEERLERLVQQSKDRARYIGLQISSFNKTTNSINPDVARLPLEYEVGSFYVALVGIGTFSKLLQTFKNYYLMVDTASEFIWTQCEGGDSYFHQDEPYYPSKSSSTYEPLLCNKDTGERHPLCVPERCDYGKCTYLAQYASGSSSLGVLAKEKFTVNSDNGALQSFDNIIMGCGFVQKDFDRLVGVGYRSGNPDVITGILGLNAGPRSFLTQLGPAGERKFAHCLMPYTYGTAPSTFLRFGSDANFGGEGQQVSTTPLVSYPANPNFYYVILQDISVGGNSLGFHPRDFEYKANIRKGGCFMDSGSPITTMYGPHFDRVAQEVVRYFLVHEGIQLVPAARRSYLQLCFRKPSEPDFKYPTMTFHFEGANFLLDEPDTIFSITANDFCLGIIPQPERVPFDVIFGAMQQARKRIVHDVGGGSLSFAKEECQLGS